MQVIWLTSFIFLVCFKSIANRKQQIYYYQMPTSWNKKYKLERYRMAELGGNGLKELIENLDEH